MFLKWIAGLLVLGVWMTSAHAEEKDAPLPFDEPAAAPQLAKKAPPTAPIKVSNPSFERAAPQAALATKAATKKMAAKPAGKRVAKISATKVSAKKAVGRKTTVAKAVPHKPVVSKKKRR